MGDKKTDYTGTLGSANAPTDKDSTRLNRLEAQYAVDPEGMSTEDLQKLAELRKSVGAKKSDGAEAAPAKSAPADSGQDPEATNRLHQSILQAAQLLANMMPQGSAAQTAPQQDMSVPSSISGQVQRTPQQ